MLYFGRPRQAMPPVFARSSTPTRLGQNKLQRAFSCFAPFQPPSLDDLSWPHAFCEVAYSSGFDTELCALHSPVFFDHTYKPPRAEIVEFRS